MSKAAIYIDTFSGALGSIPPKRRRDSAFILATLKREPWFTVFDATQHASLARTLDAMHNAGYLDYDNKTRGFPWTRAIVTPKGEQWIERATPPPDKPGGGR